MSDLRSSAGELLKELRGEKSRTTAAAELGMSRPALIALEEGQANPTLDRLERLADSYGVTFVLVAVNPATGRRVPTPRARAAAAG
jgi:transcriptional regulator with XRE-family HTH domain